MTVELVPSMFMMNSTGTCSLINSLHHVSFDGPRISATLANYFISPADETWFTAARQRVQGKEKDGAQGGGKSHF